MAIAESFRIAGFPYGRPTLPVPDDYVPTFQGSYEVLVNLFSNEIVESLTVDGSDILTAVNILEYLLTAGYSTEGRRLDVTAISIGDSSVAFAAEDSHRADMSRRIRSLRSQAARQGSDSQGGDSQGGDSQGGTITDAQLMEIVRRIIAEHAALPNVHHTPPVGGGISLPAYTQSAVEALFSRAGVLFWEAVKEVPDTPGTATGVGDVLAVTGENDTDYAWKRLQDLLSLAVGGGLAFNGQGELHTVPSIVAAADKADANKLLINGLTDDLGAEMRARVAADTALGVRVTRNENRVKLIAGFAVEPDVIVREVTGVNPLTITIRIAAVDIPSSATHLELDVQGVKANARLVKSQQDSYEFSFSALNYQTISRRSDPLIAVTLAFWNDPSAGIMVANTLRQYIRLVSATVSNDDMLKAIADHAALPNVHHTPPVGGGISATVLFNAVPPTGGKDSQSELIFDGEVTVLANSLVAWEYRDGAGVFLVPNATTMIAPMYPRNNQTVAFSTIKIVVSPREAGIVSPIQFQEKLFAGSRLNLSRLELWVIG